MATLDEKIKLLRGLLTGEVANVGPFYATIDVTRRCNLRCPGCRYHPSAIETTPSPGNQEVLDISLDLVKCTCDDLQFMGTKSLVLIGEGEPFLHRCLFDLIATAKDAGLHVTLLTNGTLLDGKRIQPLIDSRLDILKVSLWGSSAEEYERNYPGADSGNFERIVDGLQLLSSAKAAQRSKLPSVVLHQPINRHNFQSIDAMVDLVHRTGCNGLSFSPLKTRRGKLASAALSPDEENALLHTLRRLKRRLDSLAIKHNISQTILRYRIGEAVWLKMPCYIGWQHARIKVDGTVLPCNPCDLPMGNLYESSLPEIWNNLAFREFRRQTLTRAGLLELGEYCDCGFCCHAEDNRRLHRAFRWFAPWLTRPKK